MRSNAKHKFSLFHAVARDRHTQNPYRSAASISDYHVNIFFRLAFAHLFFSGFIQCACMHIFGPCRHTRRRELRTPCLPHACHATKYNKINCWQTNCVETVTLQPSILVCVWRMACAIQNEDVAAATAEYKLRKRKNAIRESAWLHPEIKCAHKVRDRSSEDAAKMEYARPESRYITILVFCNGLVQPATHAHFAEDSRTRNCTACWFASFMMRSDMRVHNLVCRRQIRLKMM